MISEWKAQRNLIISLNVFIAILGSVVTVLQKFHKKHWCRTALVFAGASITLITVLNNQVFKEDRASLQKMIASGTELLIKVDERILAYHLEDKANERSKIELDIIAALTAEWRKILGVDIQEKQTISRLTYERKIPFYLSTTLLANQEFKEEHPPWLDSPPTELNNIYLVGLGLADSYDKAQDYSYKNAIRNIQEYIEFQFLRTQLQESTNFNISSLSDYIVSIYLNNNTASKGSYHFKFWLGKEYGAVSLYYTLIGINIEDIFMIINSFKNQNKNIVPDSILMSIKTPQEKIYRNYYLDSLENQANDLIIMREKLSSQQYDKFMEGRFMRLTNLNQAIDLIRKIMEEKPDFLFGWYELAQDYNKVGNKEKALQAYQEATNIEPLFMNSLKPVLSTNINKFLFWDYGYFLYKNNKFEDARSELHKAINIDPNFILANQLLEIISKRK